MDTKKLPYILGIMVLQYIKVMQLVSTVPSQGFENQFHGKTFAEQLRAVEAPSLKKRSQVFVGGYRGYIGLWV